MAVMPRMAVVASVATVLAFGCTNDFDALGVGTSSGAGGGGNSSASTAAVGGAGPGSSTSSAGGSSSSTATGVGGQAGGAVVGGCGGGDPALIGCSDGTRELFIDVPTYPSIAGCSGAWNLGGIQTNTSMTPQCNRGAGNPGCTPDGVGCSVADLCAEGWHVCASKDDAAASSPTGCDPALGAGIGHWLTRQMVNGNEGCDGDENAHFAGCGDLGQQLSMWGTTCDPLNAVIGGVHGCPAPWVCGPSSAQEPFVVHKAAAELGGALCCAD